MADKERIRNTELKEVILQALPFAELNYCIQDALKRAVSEKKIVKLIHNDRLFVADYKEIFKLVEGTQQDLVITGATYEHKL